MELQRTRTPAPALPGAQASYFIPYLPRLCHRACPHISPFQPYSLLFLLSYLISTEPPDYQKQIFLHLLLSLPICLVKEPNYIDL